MNIDEIIGRMMGNGPAGEEKAALDAWKNEAKENIEALKDMQKIAALSDSLAGYQDFDVDQAWGKLDLDNRNSSVVSDNSSDSAIAINRTKLEEEQKNETKVRRISTWTKMAAAAAAVFAAVFMFTMDGAELSTTSNRDIATVVGQSLNVDMSDGTHIVMDQNTKLREKSDRSVSLKGRAHFDVTRNTDVPFTVSVPVGQVTVLGTKFTVDATTGRTEVFLEEGSVKFTLRNKDYFLQPGQLLKVIDGTVGIIDLKDQNYTSWKDKIIKFTDSSIPEVAAALTRHYGQVIEVSDPALFKNCSVVGQWKDVELTELLNELQALFGLEYEIHGDKRIITSSKC